MIMFHHSIFTDGVDFSPPMMSSSSSNSSGDSHSHRRHPTRGLLGMHIIYVSGDFTTSFLVHI